MENKKFIKRPITVTAYQTNQEVFIVTLEGTMKASIGDWIVTGIHGEKYPVKPNIFNKTYEAID